MHIVGRRKRSALAARDTAEYVTAGIRAIADNPLVALLLRARIATSTTNAEQDIQAERRMALRAADAKWERSAPGRPSQFRKQLANSIAFPLAFALEIVTLGRASRQTFDRFLELPSRVLGIPQHVLRAEREPTSREIRRRTVGFQEEAHRRAADYVAGTREFIVAPDTMHGERELLLALIALAKAQDDSRFTGAIATASANNAALLITLKEDPNYLANDTGDTPKEVLRFLSSHQKGAISMIDEQQLSLGRYIDNIVMELVHTMDELDESSQMPSNQQVESVRAFDHRAVEGRAVDR